jgi:predicted Zn-dependent protease
MWKLLVVALVCLCLLAAPFNAAIADGQDTYSLLISSFVWNHSTLNMLVTPAENMSWWNPLSVNATLRAVAQWNEAVDRFAVNNSDYAYLSNLRIEPQVYSQWKPGYDIYVNYTEAPISGSSDQVGLTQIYADSQNVITNCTVSLATHASHGRALSENDLQNVALHELGHSLGLGHCNYTTDLMYALYTIGDPPEEISTLDAYGVAIMFGWMTNPSSFFPLSGWLKDNAVTLPAAITYQGLPVSAQNRAPQNLADNPVVQFLILMYGLLLHPEIAAIFAALIASFVVAGIYVRHKKPRQTTADS